MAEKFTATVLGERAEEFKQVFGTATVPIKSVQKVTATIGFADGSAATREFFMIDLAALTAVQRAQLVTHLAAKFRTSCEDVEAELSDVDGLPLLASDCVVAIHAPGSYL